MEKVPPKLQIHPECRCCTKELGEAESRRGRHPATTIYQLVDTLIRDMDGVGQISLRQPHRVQELLQEHFARMDGGTMCRYANHFRKPLLQGRSVIVNNFNAEVRGGQPQVLRIQASS